MNKFYKLIALGTLSTVLVACGADEETADEEQANENGGDTEVDEGEESSELVIGATNVPHAEILEVAEDQLAEEGIDLEIETFNDYVLPNQALDNGDLDANFYQHIPFLEDQMDEFGYDFVDAGGVHIEPIGVYSQEYDSLEALPEGATILMSDSVADHGRVLTMFEDAGLIELGDVDGVEATIDDIEENPNDYEFEPQYEAALLPQAYENNEGDAVLINSNYAIDYDLSPLEDSIESESADSDNPYVNVIAVNSGDEDDEDIATLVEVLQSEEVQDFIEEEYDGAVVPVDE
ncbi:MetQ/NlpA family ABC transporter substrate-binding protein [Salicibibacter halophilus]|uniref:Lipoprotein n=1 Tax=Salicibibacter halophilus TaxID=2502791 RepID=A0A514LHM1_9BACI|nr:MetQ/NlpA family ABC transporter substrate-binding protein [Salicibibacter halophilus]QDI91343.1 MetQ/NlpA family ABC transporter substrate-binding protein [Salicibibacter halophilus]